VRKAGREGFGKAASPSASGLGHLTPAVLGHAIPVIHCPQCARGSVPEEQLPVVPPLRTSDHTGARRSPLEDAPEFVNVTCPRCGEKARRETDTMDTFGTVRYFYRYRDAQRPDAVRSGEDRILVPIDQHIGGGYAILHLIYSRFLQDDAPTSG
jgi:leucyl-tRNA synthetase